MNIRIANKDDLDGLKKLFEEVVNDLNNIKKIDMLWNDEYPFCKFEQDILNKEMYVIENENEIIGSFVISDCYDTEYDNIEWKSNNKKYFYLNRLAILPTEQGKGYAKKAMEFIENYAINNNYEAIRLTVYENNIYAIKLYEKFGFEKIEKGYWQYEDKIYIGYEKIL